MNVLFTEAAQRDLDEIIRYYDNVRPGLGDELEAEVDAAVDRIVFWPHAWSKEFKEARICMTKRFPYGVVYVPEEERIVIVAVTHLHRRPGYWKKRLKDLGS